MKSAKFLCLILGLFIFGSSNAQQEKEAASAKPGNWTVYNREVSFEKGIIHLNAQSEDGILWLNESVFGNGTIELDIKGENIPGQSFVGVAFHGKDTATFDAIYFRPFNFLNPERASHAVQYIAMPVNDWYTLRNAFPGKYENTINPVPKLVDDWFHAKIVVEYPKVKVFINGSHNPTLEIEQISSRKQGKVGLWVGNNSEGWFRNLEIKAQK